MFKSQKFKSILPYFLLALAIIAAYKIINELGFFVNVFNQILNIVSPFLYGFVLAYILNIPCAALQRLFEKSKFKFLRKRKNGLSLIIVFIIAALLVFSILNLIIPAVYDSVSFFVSSLPAYYERALEFLEYLNGLDFISSDIDISIDGISAMIQEQLKGFTPENLFSSINALFGVSSAIFNFSSSLLKGVLILITSVYSLIEKDKILKFISRLLKAFFPSALYNSTLKYANIINNNFKLYIFTQTIDGCILGTIAMIELLILKSPYALILGIMLGIANYIPYFGSIFGCVVTVIIVAFTQNLLTAVIAAAVLLITQQIDGNILQPKLLGGSFSLSPLLVMISVILGGAAAGVFGMIAAIPIVAVLKDMLQNIIERREQKKLQKINESEKPEDSKNQEDT